MRDARGASILILGTLGILSLAVLCGGGCPVWCTRFSNILILASTHEMPVALPQQS